MRRRTFITTLSAFAAAPAMPVAAPAISTASAAQHFTVASIIARAHNRCTPDMLARHLRVSPEVAQQVQAMLLKRGIITAPIEGAAMAVHPTNTNCIPNEAFRPSNVAQRALDLKAKLDDLLEESPEKTEPNAEQDTLCDGGVAPQLLT